MRRPGVASVAAAGAVLLTAACGVLPPLPESVPTRLEPSPVVGRATPAADEILSPDGFDAVTRMAVRIRNVGCASLSTGSGFAIAPTVLITNRHVVADSASLQLSTYDGRDIPVTAASTTGLADLAIVRTAQELPSYSELSPTDPRVGDRVTVVGYPQGGRLTVSEGQVIGRTSDPLNVNLGEVLVTDAPVEPGSSGSAVVDEDGEVVGVVYAKNDAGQSFIVPVSALQDLLENDLGFSPAPSCE